MITTYILPEPAVAESMVYSSAYRGVRFFQASIDNKTRPYWLDLPDNFDVSRTYPLVIYLHSFSFNYLQYVTFPMYSVLRKKFQQQGWIVVAPDDRGFLPRSWWWNETCRSDISDIIELMQKEFRINSSRIHIFGYSMGGSGALQYIRFNELVIASGLDIAGVTNFSEFYNYTKVLMYKKSLSRAFKGSPSEIPKVYRNESPIGNEYYFRHTPLMIIHDKNDRVIPINNAKNFYLSLTALNYSVIFHELSGRGHEISLYGYEQEIIDFFHKHPLEIGIVKN